MQDGRSDVKTGKKRGSLTHVNSDTVLAMPLVLFGLGVLCTSKQFFEGR